MLDGKIYPPDEQLDADCCLDPCVKNRQPTPTVEMYPRVAITTAITVVVITANGTTLLKFENFTFFFRLLIVPLIDEKCKNIRVVKKVRFCFKKILLLPLNFKGKFGFHLTKSYNFLNSIPF